MKETTDFFSADKNMVTLVNIKPKLNKEGEKRIRLDFEMPLTAEVIESAPQPVSEAFYTVVKEGNLLNPVGIVREYQGANLKFFSTHMTASADLTISECTLQDLEVHRPEKKVNLDDGDVKLKFVVNAPATRKLWIYAYENFGTDVFVTFEDAQPLLPNVKPESKADDGQATLEGIGKPETEKSGKAPVTEIDKGKKPAKKKKH